MYKKKLAIITTHPIQYNAPLFSFLAERKKISIKVFYTWGKEVLENKYDHGFGKVVKWDIPLLEGYEYIFVNNVAPDPGSHHFKGIDNPTLIEEIENWKADAILVYGWSFKSHLKAMRYFKNKIPVYFRGDSTILQQPGFFKKIIRKLFLTNIYRNVDVAFYVGTHNKAYYKNFGLKEKQLVFAPHAVDNERFQKENIKKEAVKIKKDALGVKEGEILILYAGKLDSNKNVNLLADAFTSCDFKNVHLIIAGSGPEEINLKNKFATKKNIHFLPFQNQKQMPALYALCDVFVLPSKAETWGLALNEAMAGGKTVIASSGCAAAIDLIDEGSNGYIFKNNDEVDLEEKLKMILAQKGNLAAMGDKSRKIIEEWSFLNIAEAIEYQLESQLISEG